MLKRLISIKFVTALTLTAFLVGCGATKTQHATSVVNSSLVKVEYPASTYINEASKSDMPEKRDRFLLLAAHAYINDGNYSSADQILTSMEKSMVKEATILAEHIYLQARIAEKTADVQAALTKLNYPSSWQLPRWQMATYHQYKAKLYKDNMQPIDQVRQLSLLSSYLPKAESTQINDTIWAVLQPLHEETIKSFMREPSNPVFSGWLQLSYIAKHYAVEPTQLVRYLGEWQRNNPHHPGAMQLPSDLEQALNAKPYRPKNIAVLLPLSGPRAAVAEPIKMGIMSSYMTEFDKNVMLHFIDTQDGIANAYQQALDAGADFMIGPLLPTEVEELQRLNQNKPNLIPQLYLNQADKFTPKNNQYYFSLSPVQEASDAAKKLYNDGVKLPLLLASNDAIGKRMAESFNQTWQTLTDTQAEVHFYEAGDEMRGTVQNALGVSESLARIKRMKELLGNKLEADFRSRQDIDAIYMISSSQDLSLLKGFLDVNFSVFTQPVALYTSSRGRIENESSQAALELNKVMISDIPWLMHNGDESERVKQLWANWNNSQKRLYVMGYDALDLVNRLAQMYAFPGYQFNGRSGALSVQPNGVIDRQLTWGKYQQGQLIPL